MGSNPQSQPHEFQRILKLAEPKLIITSRRGLPVVLGLPESGQRTRRSRVCVLEEYVMDHITLLVNSLAGPTARVNHVASSKQGRDPPFDFVELLYHGQSDWVRFDNAAVATVTPAAMYMTSGTSGLPKAALLSHEAIVSQHLSCTYDVPYPVSRLMSLPMFHLFGALYTHISPIRYGHPVYVLPRFDPEQFAVCISQYQVSETYLVPAMVHKFNRCSLPSSATTSPLPIYFASLRYVGVAGAPIDAGAMQYFRTLLQPDASACQIWGMTETGVTFQCRYPDQDHFGSIGQVTPGYNVCLVDSQGMLVNSEDMVGEIYIRGPGLLLRYKGREPDKDQRGWFKTGDVAYVRDGHFYIVGRTKELIKVRG